MTMSDQPSKPKPDLDSLLSSLPVDIAPSKNLWAGIKPQLTLSPMHTSTQKWPLWVAAASIVLCSLLFFMVQQPNGSQLQSIEVVQQHQATEQTQVDNNLALLIEQIAQTHQTQLAGFSRNEYTVCWQLSSHHGEHIQADISQALTELDKASIQLQEALRQQPTNQQLWQLWRWIMQRQITLLQQGQKLPFAPKSQSQGNTI
jgi:hypothetical protein